MTIKFAIITCSDTRTLETDEAGQKLEQLIAEQGWECIRRVVEMDERPFIAGRTHRRLRQHRCRYRAHLRRLGPPRCAT